MLTDRRGITSMEYGILAAAIIGVVAGVAGSIHTELGIIFNNLVDSLTNAAGVH
jgi:Flp pilus assembly pilin Flp